MSIVNKIKDAVQLSIEQLYDHPVPADGITVNETKQEFEGDYTVVLFSFVKALKKSPEQLGNELGENLVKKNSELFTGFNVIKGFLNLTINDQYWLNFLHANFSSRPSAVRSIQTLPSSLRLNTPFVKPSSTNSFPRR